MKELIEAGMLIVTAAIIVVSLLVILIDSVFYTPSINEYTLINIDGQKLHVREIYTGSATPYKR